MDDSLGTMVNKEIALEGITKTGRKAINMFCHIHDGHNVEFQRFGNVSGFIVAYCPICDKAASSKFEFLKE